MEGKERRIYSACVHEYFLDKYPIEQYKDEKHNVTCVIVESEDHNEAVFITAGASLREDFNPVEMRIMVDSKILKDKEGMAIIKKWLDQLLDTDLSTETDLSVVKFDEEFKQHFNKAGCVFLLSNCGDPIFYDDDGFFMTYPVFLNDEELKEYEEMSEDDQFDYIYSKDDDDGNWRLTY